MTINLLVATGLVLCCVSSGCMRFDDEVDLKHLSVKQAAELVEQRSAQWEGGNEFMDTWPF